MSATIQACTPVLAQAKASNTKRLRLEPAKYTVRSTPTCGVGRDPYTPKGGLTSVRFLLLLNVLGQLRCS
eukprot:7399881-Pyramimonas_sp.AAC.1